MAALTDRIRNGAAAWPKVFAASLFLYYAVIILLHRLPPKLGDMGNWAYAGMLLSRHLHGQPDSFHALKHYPVPNSTLTVLLGLLCAIVPWHVALKLFLLIYLLVCFGAVSFLARATKASPLIWLIAPAGFFLAVNFWYGFLAFQLGVAFLFVFVALLLSRMRNGMLPNWPIGLLLALLFVTHMVPFTFACLLLLLFALQTGRYRILLQAVLPVVLLCWYILGRLKEGPTEGAVARTVSPHLLSGAVWVYKANTFLKSFGYANPITSTGSHSVALAILGKPMFLGLFGINLALGAALLCIFVRVALVYRRGRDAAFLWLASALALPVYLLCPRSLLGISDPGSRILQTVLWVGLFLCIRGLSRTPERIASFGAVALALAGAILFARVPWMPEIHPSKRLPSVIELFASAPSSYAANYYEALDRGELDYQVFTTGIFLNRGALPTNPP